MDSLIPTGFLKLDLLNQTRVTEFVRAHQQSVDRAVTLKILDTSASISDREYFRKQSAMQAQITHNNLLELYDNNADYVVMEQVKVSLGQLIDKRSLGYDEARSVLQQLLEVVGAVCARGISHKDIRPGTLYLAPDYKTLKLADFHCSEMEYDMPPQATAKYCAPELISEEYTQITHEGIDLYSVGYCILELMLGREFGNIFRGVNRDHDDQMHWLEWHASPHETLDTVKSILPKCPDDLARVVNKLVEKNPVLRYQTAIEALAELDPKPLVEIYPEVDSLATPVNKTGQNEADVSEKNILEINVESHPEFHFMMDSSSPIVIGSNPKKCNIVLPFEGVSKLHAVAIRIPWGNPPRWVVTDLNSLAGLRVNGKPKGALTVLDHASVQLGSINVKLRANSIRRESQQLKKFRSFGGFLIGQHIHKGRLGDIFKAAWPEPSGKKAREELDTANQRMKNRVVALMVFREESAIDYEVWERLDRNLRSDATPRGPHFIKYRRAISRKNHRYALAIEWMGLGSLRDRISHDAPRGLEFEEIKRLGTMFCETLKYFEDYNIVHRNIDPSVVLYNTDHKPKLGGIVFLKEIDELLDKSESISMGQLPLDTPFQPPEAFTSSDPLGQRSDYYAAAATLFFAITGSPPFFGIDHKDTVNNIIRGLSQDIRSVYSQSTPELETFFRRSLALNIEQRFPDARVFESAWKLAVESIQKSQ